LSLHIHLHCTDTDLGGLAFTARPDRLGEVLLALHALDATPAARTHAATAGRTPDSTGGYPDCPSGTTGPGRPATHRPAHGLGTAVRARPALTATTHPVLSTARDDAGPVDGPSEALSALLGKTRAQLLVAAGRGATTTELGKSAGISPASASYHATILRNAGLIHSRRVGVAVLHRLTELGSALITRRPSVA